MKSSLPRALSTLVFFLPLFAHAHPGHDGDHDFVWDFGHLISHPFATIAIAMLVIAAGWGCRQLLRNRPAPKSKSARRD